MLKESFLELKENLIGWCASVCVCYGKGWTRTVVFSQFESPLGFKSS